MTVPLRNVRPDGGGMVGEHICSPQSMEPDTVRSQAAAADQPDLLDRRPRVTASE
jgi:hypothetical protein